MGRRVALQWRLTPQIASGSPNRERGKDARHPVSRRHAITPAGRPTSGTREAFAERAAKRVSVRPASRTRAYRPRPPRLDRTGRGAAAPVRRRKAVGNCGRPCRAGPWPAARPQHAHHRRRRARRHAQVHHWVAARPPPPPDQAPATAPIFVESLRSRRSGPLLTNINKSRSPSRSKSRSPQAAPLAVEPVEDAKAAPDALRRDLGERRCPPTHRR